MISNQEKNENRISLRNFIYERILYLFVKFFFYLFFRIWRKVNEIFMPRKDVEENHIAGMGNTYVLFDSVDDIKML